jgi:hypothetical protein
MNFSLSYSDFLKDTLFGKTISYHNMFCEDVGITDVKLGPVSSFKKRESCIDIAYSYNNILSIKENNKITGYILQTETNFFYVYPTELLYNKCMFGVGCSNSKLESSLPSYNLPELNLSGSEYSMMLTTKIKNLELGFSYIFYPTDFLGEIKIDSYPHSNNDLENQYLYDPLERYFGKEMYLSQQSNDDTTILEAKYKFNLTNSCLLRTKQSLINERFVLKHYNSDKNQWQHLDIPVGGDIKTFEICFLHKLNKKIVMKPILNFGNTQLNYDFIPREAVPKKDVTDFGDVVLKTINYGFGLATYFNLTDKLNFFTGGVFSKDEYDIKCYFSTPVLGYELGFLPVLHRIHSNIKIYTPSIYYNFGMQTKFKLLDFDFVINYHCFDIDLNLSGRTDMMAGLQSSYINKQWYIKNALQIFYLYSKIETSIIKGIKICYDFVFSLPLVSDEVVRLLKEEAAVELQPPPPEVYVKKEITGGMTHTISLKYSF